MRGGGDVFCKNCPRPLSNSPPPLKKLSSGRSGRSPSLSGGKGFSAPEQRKGRLSYCHACCLIEGILAACPAESHAPPYIAISGSTLVLASRTPAWWHSKTIRPVFSVFRHQTPTDQRRKKRKADILRMSAFPCPSVSDGDLPKRSYERFLGRGGELVGRRPPFFRWERPKAARRAVPVATEEATGIDSNAKGFPSPRTSLSLLPSVLPAPRRGRGHPDGWQHNWRVRSRRRTGRCASA